MTRRTSSVLQGVVGLFVVALMIGLVIHFSRIAMIKLEGGVSAWGVARLQQAMNSSDAKVRTEAARQLQVVDALRRPLLPPRVDNLPFGRIPKLDWGATTRPALHTPFSDYIKSLDPANASNAK